MSGLRECQDRHTPVPYLDATEARSATTMHAVRLAQDLAHAAGLRDVADAQDDARSWYWEYLRVEDAMRLGTDEYLAACQAERAAVTA